VNVPSDPSTQAASTLFRHVTAEKAELYRAIMDVFAAAKRQFRLHLRPDEVRADANWAHGEAPALEIVQQALAQLAEWGNLLAQPDTTRVASIEDFYRARFVYRLSSGGEAVEAAMAAFVEAFARRAELQSVALEDILLRLSALEELAGKESLDVVKVHEALRDLSAVFASLADNAQAFMASVARSIDLSRSDASALMAYKSRLIDYLERFIGDLVARSSAIAQHLLNLAPHVDVLLLAAARREARDAAPDDALAGARAVDEKLAQWQERWRGLSRWFLSEAHALSQAELLRNRARSAIPQLLAAIAALNERRSGKSDRSADFRVLARWFAECESDEDAHRLYRAAFALSPARHLALAATTEEVAANTPWADAPAVTIHPKLRERGSLTPRGAPPQVRDRERERMLMRQRLADEEAELERARRRLARGEPVLLSELGELDRHEFALLLSLIGEALGAQTGPDAAVERASGDGLLHIKLEPLAPDSRAQIHTEHGVLSGRDHRLTVSYASVS
jgi:uncharacterized protein (TIGR02677 family)